MVTVSPIVSEDGQLMDFDVSTGHGGGVVSDINDYYVQDNQVHNRWAEVDSESMSDDYFSGQDQINEGYWELVGGRQNYENMTAWAAATGWEHTDAFDAALDTEDYGHYEDLLRQLIEDFTNAGNPTEAYQADNSSETDDFPYVNDYEDMQIAYDNADDETLDALVDGILQPSWDVEQLEALEYKNQGTEYGAFAAMLANVAAGDIDPQYALEAASERWSEPELLHLWDKCEQALRSQFGGY